MSAVCLLKGGDAWEDIAHAVKVDRPRGKGIEVVGRSAVGHGGGLYGMAVFIIVKIDGLSALDRLDHSAEAKGGSGCIGTHRIIPHPSSRNQ